MKTESSSDMKPVVFVGLNANTYSANALRGFLLVEALQKEASASYKLIHDRSLLQTKSSIVIFIKIPYSPGIQTIINKLKRENNTILFDLLDTFEKVKDFLALPNVLPYLSSFDLILSPNVYIDTMLKRSFLPSKILYHSSDPRICVDPLPRAEVWYYGVQNKLELNDTKDYNLSFLKKLEKDNFTLQHFPCVHIAFIKESNPYFYQHTTTKLAVALYTNSVFVSIRNPTFESLLGKKYPFFASTEGEFHLKVKEALELIQDTSRYTEYCKSLEAIKEKLSFTQTLKEYTEILSVF
jgi:hypothetical protein